MNLVKTKRNLAKKFKAQSKFIIVSFLLLALIIIAFLYFKFFVAAIVNGRIIQRYSVINQLEAQGGAQVLNDLITKELVFQEAIKRSIFIPQEEIDQEIENVKNLVESQSLTLDEALKYQGQTLESFTDLLRVQKIVEKLFAEELAVSEDEINSYFEQNRADFGEDVELKGDLKEQIRKLVYQDKVSAKFQELVEELRSNANIKRFLNY